MANKQNVYVELPVLNEREAYVVEKMKEFKKLHYYSAITVVHYFTKYRDSKGYAQNNFKDPLKKSDRNQYNSFCAKVEGLDKAFESFNNFNSAYQENILSAFILDKYIYVSDFSVGDLVFSNELGYIGYAGDLEKSYFNLYNNNAMRSNGIIGTFETSKFVKVRLIK